MTIEVRRAVATDFERVAAMRDEAFRRPLRSAAWQRGEGRVLVEDGQIQATVLAEPMGQFYGGRSIPTAAVSGVAVATGERGRGLSTAILRETFLDLRRQGVMLSTLMPSIVGAYRRAGYECAGSRVEYRTRIDRLPADAATRVEPWDESNLAEIIECYQCVARSSNGMFDRSSNWWHERVLEPAPDQPFQRRLVRRDGKVSGYFMYTQQPLASNHGMDFVVACREFIWSDLDSANALFAYLGQNRPFGTELHWFGPTNEPLAACLGYLPIEVAEAMPLMLRLIDVAGALRARGYSNAVSTSVDLTIVDRLLTENNGALRIAVADGCATVDPLPAATATVDVGTLAALFSGWLRAGDAVRLGRLTGATAAEIDRLDLLFAGPPAWSPDWI